MLQFVLFVIGFFLLVRGAEWLLDGASVFAKRAGFSDLLIGLTLVAFGTSLPELVVNLFASEAGSSGLAIGNVMGSNAANTLLVLGIVAIMKPLTVHRVIVWREILFSVLAVVMLFILAADAWILQGEGFNGLDTIDGLVLLSYFTVFMYYLFTKSKFVSKKPSPILSKNTKQKGKNTLNWLLKVAVGSLALFLGGKWIVYGATYGAQAIGVSDAVIGVTVVAIGTSLPELAASVVAVRRGSTDIAVGNIVGSNLFNILWVLGLSSIIRPLPFDNFALIEVVVGISIAMVLFISVAFGRFKHQISAFEGQFFLSLYALYLISLAFR